ncbi:hypothetical protein KGA66_02405 [Actinocrinis puniceicyclus]|uniref:Type II toxin-antitoxin system HicA family toxin n=1 Tax=Actinocrinis puniceicyclus TaxID=977794 RepID=A0A8J8BAA5_9ACTN|nr:hypothetical protein [Actinocrinis puniceicyclus]MBS2961883.1 hypothetical protein [Actinocrinis puniceicyclus]
MRLPTFAQLRKFVEVEGWDDKDKLSSKRTGDHHRYVITTPTGERLMTRVSHGAGQIADRDLFAHILRDQLQVTEAQFWDAVDHGVGPERPTLPGPDPAEGPSVDAKLARNLLTKVGMTQPELIGLTQAEAVAIWQHWLTTGERPSVPADQSGR